MPGPEAILDLLVIARARIGVLDQQANGRAGGATFEHPGDEAHRILLATLADKLRRPGAPPVHIALQVSLGQFQSRRTAVNNAAEGRAMAFAQVVTVKSRPKVFPDMIACLGT